MACGILVPRPGIELASLALEAWSHWPAWPLDRQINFDFIQLYSLTITFYFYDCIMEHYNANILCIKEYTYFHTHTQKTPEQIIPADCNKAWPSMTMLMNNHPRGFGDCRCKSQWCQDKNLPWVRIIPSSTSLRTFTLVGALFCLLWELPTPLQVDFTIDLAQTAGSAKVQTMRKRNTLKMMHHFPPVFQQVPTLEHINVQKKKDGRCSK